MWYGHGWCGIGCGMTRVGIEVGVASGVGMGRVGVVLGVNVSN